jgi:hypothetical protein
LALFAFVNIGEQAGRSDEAVAAGPKMAALLAIAASPSPEAPFVQLDSAGVALIYGRDENAIEAANLVRDHLDITVLPGRPGEAANERQGAPDGRISKHT